MLVSVVIIFYNQNSYVKRALRSVVDQTYNDLDIIVVDDGSTEEIEDNVYYLSDSRIRFFKKENGGPASARNLGIEKAMGSYVAFLDGDDVYLPTRIEMFVNLMETNGNPVCVAATGSYVVDGKGRFINRMKPKSYHPGEMINTSLVRPSCAIYRSEIFEKMGGFPESLQSNEDGALNAVIAQHYPVLSLPLPLVLYLKNDAGLARRHLIEYESAVHVMEQKLAYIAERAGTRVSEGYRDRAYQDLLFGFLSSGNLNAARAWRLKNPSLVFDRSLATCLALFSIKTGINLYYITRRIYSMLTSLRYIPAQVRYRKHLQI